MIAVGIDLGTTNTVLAAARGTQVSVLADEHGHRLMPSVVSFHPGGEILVGHGAKARRLVDARNTVASTKRLLGASFVSPQVHEARARFAFELREGPGASTLVAARGNVYTLPEISAFVLKRARAIASYAVGADVDHAVVTVPAHFNELQRASTKVAARVAGLDVLRVLNEPTAAALAYGFGRAGRERVAVYDFGGGTFDCTILDLNGSVFEVLATAGDTFLGGDDLDGVIAMALADRILRERRFDARSDPQVMERLRDAAERLKVMLSFNAQAHVRVEELYYDTGGRPVHVDLVFSQGEFELLAKPFLDRTFAVAQDAMQTARISSAGIDRVVLVGGCTRIPLVRQRVSAFFGSEAYSNINPDEVVAIGAAVQAMALTESGPLRAIPAPPPLMGAHNGPVSAAINTLRGSGIDGVPESHTSAETSSDSSGEEPRTLTATRTVQPPQRTGSVPPMAARSPSVGPEPVGQRSPSVPPDRNFGALHDPASLTALTPLFTGGALPALPPDEYSADTALSQTALATRADDSRRPESLPTTQPNGQPPMGTTQSGPSVMPPGAFGEVDDPASVVMRAVPSGRPPGMAPGMPLGARPATLVSQVHPAPQLLAQRDSGASGAPGARSQRPPPPSLPPAASYATQRLPAHEPMAFAPTFAGILGDNPASHDQNLGDGPRTVAIPGAPGVPHAGAPAQGRFVPGTAGPGATQMMQALHAPSHPPAPPPARAPAPAPTPPPAHRAPPGPQPYGQQPPQQSAPQPYVQQPIARPHPQSNAPAAAPQLGPALGMPAGYGQIDLGTGAAPSAPPQPAARPATARAPAAPNQPLLIDVTPRALVVETSGGFIDVVLPRNAQIPCARTRRFATARDGQTSVRVRVAQGEEARFAANTYLGELELSGISQGRRGEVILEVSFELDESGTLLARAQDLATGLQASAHMQLSQGLDEKSIISMIERSASVSVSGRGSSMIPGADAMPSPLGHDTIPPQPAPPWLAGPGGAGPGLAAGPGRPGPGGR